MACNQALEPRVVLSFFGSVGNWFSSQYHHVTQDLGITHKHAATASDGIVQLWKNSAALSKPVAEPQFHGTHVKAG